MLVGGFALALLSVGQASGQNDPTPFETAITAAIDQARPIDALDQPQSTTVLPLGGGRAPLRVVADSSLAFSDGFPVDGPVFADAGDGGLEVIQDFVPESTAFYDVSTWRVVHAFKLSETLDACSGLQEFALFYTVAGAAAFEAVDGITSPDVGTTHATAMNCTDGVTRALHVQASQRGVEFATPHRIMLVTAPDPSDPTTRSTYLIVVSENPDVVVHPTLTTADDPADPASWSWRQYAGLTPVRTTLAAESARPEVVTANALFRGSTSDVVPEEVEGVPEAEDVEVIPEAEEVVPDEEVAAPVEPVEIVADLPEEDPGDGLEWFYVAIPLAIAGVVVAVTWVAAKRRRAPGDAPAEQVVWRPSTAVEPLERAAQRPDQTRGVIAAAVGSLRAAGETLNSRGRYVIGSGDISVLASEFGEGEMGEDLRSMLASVEFESNPGRGCLPFSGLIERFHPVLPSALELDPETGAIYRVEHVEEDGEGTSIGSDVIVS